MSSTGSGPRKTLLISVLLSALGTVLFATSSSLAPLALGRAVTGFGMSAVAVAAMKIFAIWYRKDQFATCSGILLAVGNMGALLSTAPLMLMVSAMGWREAFWIIGLYTLVVSVVSFIIIRDKPSDLQYCFDPTQYETVSAEKVSIPQALKSIFLSKDFYLVSILVFIYYGTFMGLASLWLGPYLNTVYGLPKSTTSTALMMFPLGMIIGCPLSGYLSEDKVVKSSKRVLLYGGILYLASYIPLILFTDVIPLVFLFILLFYCGITGGFFIMSIPCLKQIMPQDRFGTATGAINAIMSLGGGFYPILSGRHSQHSEQGRVYGNGKLPCGISVCGRKHFGRNCSLFLLQEGPRHGAEPTAERTSQSRCLIRLLAEERPRFSGGERDRFQVDSRSACRWASGGSPSLRHGVSRACRAE